MSKNTEQLYVVNERWYTPPNHAGGVATKLATYRPMLYGLAFATIARWRAGQVALATGLSDFWLAPV